MKNNLILMVSLAVILIVGVGVLFYKFNQNDYAGNLPLKTNIVLELGSQASTNLDDYINYDGLSKEKIDDIKANAKLHLPETNVSSEGYLNAGDQSFYVEYEGKHTFSNIVVKDTTPPKIDETKSVMLPLYIEVDDFSKYIQISDYSPCTIEILDTGGFTSRYDGSFTITVKAKDSAGNEAILKQPIKVSWLAGNADQQNRENQ